MYEKVISVALRKCKLPHYINIAPPIMAATRSLTMKSFEVGISSFIGDSVVM